MVTLRRESFSFIINNMSIGTFFGESGAEMIAEVLKNKSMLTKLKLRCNEMDKKMGKKNSLQKGTE